MHKKLMVSDGCRYKRQKIHDKTFKLCDGELRPTDVQDLKITEREKYISISISISISMDISISTHISISIDIISDISIAMSVSIDITITIPLTVRTAQF